MNGRVRRKTYKRKGRKFKRWQKSRTVCSVHTSVGISAAIQAALTSYTQRLYSRPLSVLLAGDRHGPIHDKSFIAVKYLLGAHHWVPLR